MHANLARRRQLDLLAGQIAEEIRTSPKVFEASQKLTDKPCRYQPAHHLPQKLDILITGFDIYFDETLEYMRTISLHAPRMSCLASAKYKVISSSSRFR